MLGKPALWGPAAQNSMSLMARLLMRHAFWADALSLTTTLGLILGKSGKINKQNFILWDMFSHCGKWLGWIPSKMRMAGRWFWP